MNHLTEPFRCLRLGYLSTPADIFSIMSFRMSDTRMLSNKCVSFIVYTCVFWIACLTWGYEDIFLVVLMKLSRLHGWGRSLKQTSSTVIYSLEDPTVKIQKRRGKKNTEYTLRHLSRRIWMYLTLIDLKVFVGCDPVPPNSQHTNDVMFVWKKLHVIWLWLLLLQTHWTQTANDMFYLLVRRSPRTRLKI